MVGASGAISGVMGAYVILYPLVRVHTLVFLGILITRVALPAYLMLGYWFLLQLLGGLPAVGGNAPGGVAFWAHVGGFLAGALLIPFFKDRALAARRRRAASFTGSRRRSVF
jgi:membrane associated rhomboid family serine protease